MDVGTHMRYTFAQSVLILNISHVMNKSNTAFTTLFLQNPDFSRIRNTATIYSYRVRNIFMNCIEVEYSIVLYENYERPVASGVDEIVLVLVSCLSCTNLYFLYHQRHQINNASL